MNITYYRGDDHTINFRFKNLNGKAENVIFVVKDIDGSIKINKKIGDGISSDGNEYSIVLKPEDTNGLTPNRRMIYDIKIVLNKLTYTVKRGYFKLL
jgi:hypothetical protein